MAVGAPQQPDDNKTRRRRARLAAWSQAIGVALAITTLTCTLLGLISAQQAVALGLPAVLLIVGGLIASAIDQPASGRHGFVVGLRVGKCLRRLRSTFRGR